MAKRPPPPPPTMQWGELDETARGRVADKILYGRYGALGHLVRAEHLAQNRPDLAVRAARQAGELYAGVGELGYQSDEFERRFWALLELLEKPPG